MGQEDLDRLCLSQWDRHAACTKPVPLGLGPARSKETCPGPMDRSYTHAGVLSLSQDQPYAHDGTCPSPTCPNLSHKVGLQLFTPTKWDYKAVNNWSQFLKKLCHRIFHHYCTSHTTRHHPGLTMSFPQSVPGTCSGTQGGTRVPACSCSFSPVPSSLFPAPPLRLYLRSETPAKKYFPPKRKMLEESQKEEGW